MSPLLDGVFGASWLGSILNLASGRAGGEGGVRDEMDHSDWSATVRGEGVVKWGALTLPIVKGVERARREKVNYIIGGVTQGGGLEG